MVFSGAARRRDISRAKPTGQGMQLPAADAHYNDCLGGTDYADLWRPVVHPAGALRESAALCARRLTHKCLAADAHVLGTSLGRAFTACSDRSAVVRRAALRIGRTGRV